MFRAHLIAMTMAICLLGVARLHGQDGTLQAIRDDVRQGRADGVDPGAPVNPAPPRQENPRRPDANSAGDRWVDDTESTLFTWGACAAGMTVTSPLWVPMAVLQDDLSRVGHFAGFPYDHDPGYIVDSSTAGCACNWAGRFDVEYVASFDAVDKVGGHLLLETTSRFGLELRGQYLQERLRTGAQDQLWLGDCNLTFRFAQSNWAQFRTGLGLNWLADNVATDVGFNFLYGTDLFPRKPWVLSATLDAGTLGHAALFRFQATAGAMINRFEFYTGYEYADIERTHWNGLIGGIRLWF